MTSRRALALALVLVPWLARCGGDKNHNPPLDTGEDTVIDTVPDSTGDPTTDPIEDPVTETPTGWRTCAKTCTSAEGCCLSGGRPCGEYPNKWTCDGVCMTAGCADDAECVTWATAIGLSGAADYKCNTAHLYYTAGYCVPGCTTADDCCPSSTDCSAYPQRRLCEDGGCEVDGCVSDTECQGWAAGLGLPDSGSFVCRTFEYSDTATCARPCTTITDCCPSGTCGAFPNNVACIEGHCLSTCVDDLECRDWAISHGYPGALDYVCHAF